MFKIFGGNKLTDPDHVEHALIIDGAFDSGIKFGSSDEKDALQNLEKELTDAFGHIGAEFDGHEAGEGTFTLYMYGKDAEQMFSAVELILKKSLFAHLEVTKRFGTVQDKNAREERFTLYEPGLKGRSSNK